MPRLARLFSISCLCSTVIAVESCAQTSQSRTAAEPQVMMSCQPDVPQQIDSTVRFQREISSDSTLAPGEIDGSLVSAATGEPVPSARITIVYPDHHHTERTVVTDADGHFRMKGLPNEDGILHAGTDSVVVNPIAKPVVRFALRATAIHLSC
jgi:hypothetical protein